MTKTSLARAILKALHLARNTFNLFLTNEQPFMITSKSNQSQNFPPENFDQRDLFALIQKWPGKAICGPSEGAGRRNFQPNWEEKLVKIY